MIESSWQLPLGATAIDSELCAVVQALDCLKALATDTLGEWLSHPPVIRPASLPGFPSDAANLVLDALSYGAT